MAGSQSFGSPGAVPPLTLRAWVLFTGVNGAIQKSSPNVSSVTRSVAGNYVVNLSAAMGDTLIACDVRPQAGSGQTGIFVCASGPASSLAVNVFTYMGGIATDAGSVYVGIYG